MNLSGEWVFTEAIKLEWGHLVGPQSNRTSIPIRRGNWDTDTYRWKVIWNYREKTAICKPRREAWGRLSLSSLKGHQPSQHLDFRLLPLELCDHIFLLFKPLSLWYFTPTALAHRHPRSFLTALSPCLMSGCQQGEDAARVLGMSWVDVERQGERERKKRRENKKGEKIQDGLTFYHP